MHPSACLCDHAALLLHRARAHAPKSTSTSNAWFLHDFAIQQIQERLKEVNRTFTSPAIVGGRANQWANALKPVINATPTCFADSDTIGLPPAKFDLIVHGLSLHWANDAVGQLVQMRLALKPDGLMIAVFFGGQSLHELRTAFTLAESQICGGVSPRVVPMAEIRDGGALLQRAGLALPVADTLRLDLSYETPLALMSELRAMGEANAQTARAKRFMRRDLLARVCAIYGEQFSLPNGRVGATAELVFLTGWAAADNQQKPLRAGSAQVSLQDVLGRDLG
ncbi:MAG: SAM-dependent methyltransferase [Candidatus Halichondribacter symbioticus]